MSSLVKVTPGNSVRLVSLNGAMLTRANLTAVANVDFKGTATLGAITADPSTVIKSVVHALPAGSSTGTTAVPRLRGAGSITAVNRALVTVALSDANFLPSRNSLVVDTRSARFAPEGDQRAMRCPRVGAPAAVALAHFRA